MKQLFLILSVFALVFGMTSCGAGYDLDKCKTLQEKIDNGDELTQEDYADIIGQAKALCGFLENKVKGYADLESLKEAEEYEKSYAVEDDFYGLFMRTLKSADLDENNAKAFDELKEADKNYKETHEKAATEALKKMMGGALDSLL